MSKHNIQVEIGHYFPCDHGSLVGRFSMVIYPLGFTFYDCKYFETPTGKKFFTFPDKQIRKNPDEKPEYMPLIRILDKEYQKALSEEVMRQIKPLAEAKKTYKGASQDNVRPPQQAKQNTVQDDAFDLPF